MNLETLKNNFAQEQGYEDFESFVIGSYSPDSVSKWAAIGDFQAVMEVICIRAQKELKHPIYERIQYYEELADKYKDNAYNNRKYTYKAAGLKDALRIITNPENLIR